ncbi:hypothetical protein BC829DRAFT_181309 [Chytridium lagenaria]|nr:hypothetical protein BC829DRAFT_181309 [Chytridium lagenaria]
MAEITALRAELEQYRTIHGDMDHLVASHELESTAAAAHVSNLEAVNKALTKSVETLEAELSIRRAAEDGLRGEVNHLKNVVEGSRKNETEPKIACWRLKEVLRVFASYSPPSLLQTTATFPLLNILRVRRLTSPQDPPRAGRPRVTAVETQNIQHCVFLFLFLCCRSKRPRF